MLSTAALYGGKLNLTFNEDSRQIFWTNIFIPGVEKLYWMNAVF